LLAYFLTSPYLYIAAGGWILAHFALPVRDPFSHSLAGASWVRHEWQSEVVLAAVYRAAGWSGLVLLGTACFGATSPGFCCAIASRTRR
jgi:hypothetical protein